jgi:hypothetical protein
LVRLLSYKAFCRLALPNAKPLGGDRLRPPVCHELSASGLLLGAARTRGLAELRSHRHRLNRSSTWNWLAETADGSVRSPEAAIRTSGGHWVDRPDRIFALCCANTRVGSHTLSDLQSTLGSHPNPPLSRSPAARRMARHRRRRRDGMRCVTVELRETEIDQLIRCRLLAPSSRADPLALRKAVHGLFDQLFP